MREDRRPPTLGVMSSVEAQRGSGARKVRKPRASKARSGTTPKVEAQRRTSVYRGATREAAADAYHADAAVMARMGFVPEAEAWSTAEEQVLDVRYVSAPEDAPAVLEALEQPGEYPPDVATPASAAVVPGARPGLVPRPVVKLLVRASLGIALGVVLCLVLGTFAGETPDAISLVGFGAIGLFLGSILSIAGD